MPHWMGSLHTIGGSHPSRARLCPAPASLENALVIERQEGEGCSCLAAKAVWGPQPGLKTRFTWQELMGWSIPRAIVVVDVGPVTENGVSSSGVVPDESKGVERLPA